MSEQPDPNEVEAVIADALAEWISSNADLSRFTQYNSEMMHVNGMRHVNGAMFELGLSETNGERRWKVRFTIDAVAHQIEEVE
jgi:hypothetical protein